MTVQDDGLSCLLTSLIGLNALFEKYRLYGGTGFEPVITQVLSALAVLWYMVRCARGNLSFSDTMSCAGLSLMLFDARSFIEGVLSAVERGESITRTCLEPMNSEQVWEEAKGKPFNHDIFS